MYFTAEQYAEGMQLTFLMLQVLGIGLPWSPVFYFQEEISKLIKCVEQLSGSAFSFHHCHLTYIFLQQLNKQAILFTAESGEGGSNDPSQVIEEMSGLYRIPFLVYTSWCFMAYMQIPTASYRERELQSQLIQLQQR